MVVDTAAAVVFELVVVGTVSLVVDIVVVVVVMQQCVGRFVAVIFVFGFPAAAGAALAFDQVAFAASGFEREVFAASTFGSSFSAVDIEPAAAVVVVELVCIEIEVVVDTGGVAVAAQVCQLDDAAVVDC